MAESVAMVVGGRRMESGAATMSRLDQLLVERGLVSSRSRAQDLIKGGQVFLKTSSGTIAANKPSMDVDPSVEIVLQEGAADKYVSRGGLKLDGALTATDLDVRGLRALDLGQSTGGFTDCLLQRGAAAVVGIEVGHGQLHPRLSADSRVRAFEKFHVKDLATDRRWIEFFDGKSPDLVVADLSFISLIPALKVTAAMVSSGTLLLALVKPQFEVGPEGLGKGGVVRDPLLYEEVERKMKEQSAAAGWTTISYFPSSIEGRDGNREFFIYARKA